MKKILHLAALCLMLISFVCCHEKREWSEQQRAEFIASIDPYREMIYLSDLDDTEFMIFSDGISTTAQIAYPVYTQLILMPTLSDTIDMWVVNSIVEEIDSDASNMRHLYPYHSLVMQGVLPAGLSHEDRMMFYSCLSQKVNARFASLEEFFYAVITNSFDPNIITTMQSECAAEFGSINNSDGNNI
ncbi:MAG: hypothetical protein SNI45_02785 [Rikenellaceae bacterium]